MLSRILALVGASGGDASPASPAQRARGVLDALGHISGGLSDAVVRPGGEAILSAAQQAELDGAKDEAGIVRYLTPVIARLRGCARSTAGLNSCDPVLVNSEQQKWLDHPAGGGQPDLRLKPGLFRTWAPFIKKCAGGKGQGEGADYIFGELASVALQRANVVTELYEGKFDALSRAEFGALCAYHDALGLRAGVCRGVLFNARHFWLYKTVRSNPTKLVRARWADGGSADVFRAFFEPDVDDELDSPEPPLLCVLRNVLARLGAEPCAAPDGRRYLGSGSTGHVFAVRRSATGGAVMAALKIVLSSNAACIGAEYTRMNAAFEAGAPVVPVVAHSLTVVDVGAGFLLEHVGVVAVVASQRACVRAFTALAALHVVGVTHGDARLANLLVVDGQLRWIDLLGGVVAAAERATGAFDALARADAE